MYYYTILFIVMEVNWMLTLNVYVLENHMQWSKLESVTVAKRKKCNDNPSLAHIPIGKYGLGKLAYCVLNEIIN